MIVGEAGSGKSSIASKIIKQWADKTEFNEFKCALYLTVISSSEQNSLYKSVWGGYSFGGECCIITCTLWLARASCLQF